MTTITTSGPISKIINNIISYIPKNIFYLDEEEIDKIRETGRYKGFRFLISFEPTSLLNIHFRCFRWSIDAFGYIEYVPGIDDFRYFALKDELESRCKSTEIIV
jgi:hypothetical protein